MTLKVGVDNKSRGRRTVIKTQKELSHPQMNEKGGFGWRDSGVCASTIIHANNALQKIKVLVKFT